MRGVNYDSWLEQPYQEDARAQAEAEALAARTCEKCGYVADEPLEDNVCDDCAETMEAAA